MPHSKNGNTSKHSSSNRNENTITSCSKNHASRNASDCLGLTCDINIDVQRHKHTSAAQHRGLGVRDLGLGVSKLKALR